MKIFERVMIGVCGFFWLLSLILFVACMHETGYQHLTMWWFGNFCWWTLLSCYWFCAPGYRREHEAGIAAIEAQIEAIYAEIEAHRREALNLVGNDATKH